MDRNTDVQLKMLEEIIRDESPMHYCQPDVDKYDIAKFLPQSEIDTIIEYLKGPAKVGIWGINTTLNLNGFYKYFKENCMDNEIQKIVEKWYRTAPHGLRHEKFSTNQFIRVSFIFSLFYYIQQKDNETVKKTIERVIRPDDMEIILKLNHDTIKKDFQKAFKIFNEEIIFDQFIPMANDGSIFLFLNHHCIIERDYLELTIYSTGKESIEIMVRFFNELNHIEQTKISRFFSPSEVAFSVYVPYLEPNFRQIVSSKELQEKISIAISEFNQGSYSHCVNTLGIFTESLLIQIFETLFRQELNRKMPMGELFYYIQENVQETVNPQKESSKANSESNNANIDRLFREIKETSTQIGKEPSEKINEQVLKIITKAIQYSKVEDYNLREILMRHLQKDGRITIFPESKLANFNELREYRNAISHRSKIQINEFEAIRSFYCCISLHTWWMETIDAIDWTSPKDEIIKKLVECKIE
ncbi:hypothetical protein [Methanofollis sp. UBA420]|jgi:hypothetical protein|uniref:hypothetical protein n=1 Tax=Methanofollis sp. UBA420 TaxID=1915514 RepID=UPI00316AC410